MKYFIILACVVLCTMAVPLPEVELAKPVQNVELLIEGAETPADVAESIRRARQVFEDITVDIVQGGGGGGGFNNGYGGQGGYGGFQQGGYGGALQSGYGGFQPNGYGAYGGGGNQGFQETNVEIVQDNYGK